MSQALKKPQDQQTQQKRLRGKQKKIKLKFNGQLTNPVGYPNLFPLYSKEDIIDLKQQIYDHMASGKSFHSFASKLDISFQTLYDYVSKYPELAEIKRIAESKALDFWEETGIKGIVGITKGFNATAYIFKMKNKFPDLYRDKVEIETTNTHIYELKGIDLDKYNEALKRDKFLLADEQTIEVKEEEKA